MKTPLLAVLRVAVTTLTVAAAAVAAWQLWSHFQLEPRTRNARVRAEVVKVAPDVSGLVARVEVRDNQVVTRGQVLFVIDPARFALALQQAEATVASQRVVLVQAEREAARNRELGNLVAREVQEQGAARVQQARANLDDALSRRDLARLNLERTSVTAPVNGTVTNLELHPGDYVSAGQRAVAVLDSDSFRVDGYFEETKLTRIHVGDPVSVGIMGEDRPLVGHVESIASGIEDRDRASGPDLLANVNPTFSWVRLAQRVPVRVALDRVPPDVRLVAGRTASVTVLPPPADTKASAAR